MKQKKFSIHTIINGFDLYVCGDLAFFGTITGRESTSNRNCVWCDLTYKEYNQQSHRKGKKFSYDELHKLGTKWRMHLKKLNKETSKETNESESNISQLKLRTHVYGDIPNNEQIINEQNHDDTIKQTSSITQLQETYPTSLSSTISTQTSTSCTSINISQFNDSYSSNMITPIQYHNMLENHESNNQSNINTAKYTPQSQLKIDDNIATGTLDRKKTINMMHIPLLNNTMSESSTNLKQVVSQHASYAGDESVNVKDIKISDSLINNKQTHNNIAHINTTYETSQLINTKKK